MNSAEDSWTDGLATAGHGQERADGRGGRGRRSRRRRWRLRHRRRHLSRQVCGLHLKLSGRPDPPACNVNAAIEPPYHVHICYTRQIRPYFKFRQTLTGVTKTKRVVRPACIACSGPAQARFANPCRLRPRERNACRWSGQRALQRWEPAPGEEALEELEAGSNFEPGWNQFELNEAKFGVQSTWDEVGTWCSAVSTDPGNSARTGACGKLVTALTSS